MIDEKQDSVRRELYEQWRRHPITKMLLDNLERDKQFYVNSISKNATDTDVADLKIRYYSFGIKNSENIASMITNYEKFTKYIPGPKQE